MTFRAAAKGRKLLLLAAVCLASVLLLSPTAEASRSLSASAVDLTPPVPSWDSGAPPAPRYDLFHLEDDLLLEILTGVEPEHHQALLEHRRLELLSTSAIQKTASGVSTSDLELNVQKGKPLKPDLRWAVPFYAKARFYDPEVGRFLNEDPAEPDLTTPPSLHKYLYAYGNPTYYTDPDGREVIKSTNGTYVISDIETGEIFRFSRDRINENPDAFKLALWQGTESKEEAERLFAIARGEQSPEPQFLSEELKSSVPYLVVEEFAKQGIGLVDLAFGGRFTGSKAAFDLFTSEDFDHLNKEERLFYASLEFQRQSFAVQTLGFSEAEDKAAHAKMLGAEIGGGFIGYDQLSQAAVEFRAGRPAEGVARIAAGAGALISTLTGLTATAKGLQGSTLATRSATRLAPRIAPQNAAGVRSPRIDLFSDRVSTNIRWRNGWRTPDGRFGSINTSGSSPGSVLARTGEHRNVFVKANPKFRKFVGTGKMEVHHRIPEIYFDEGLFLGNRHGLSNLYGLPTDVHRKIVTPMWSQFRAANPNATASQVSAFAQQVDRDIARFINRIGR